MKISIFGLGYVGTICAATFSSNGHNVIGVDVDSEKVDLINSGESPIVEKGIDNLISMGHNENLLSATLDSEYAVKNTEYAIICVGTPLLPNGDLDMSYILKSAESGFVQMAWCCPKLCSL